MRTPESDVQSFLPLWIRDLPYKGRIADCLGLFGLLVLVLGLPCFLGGSSMTIQDADDLQSLGFFFLGTGQLLFLRKKLPILLKKKLRLFSRPGWYYIGVLCTLLVVLLLLLYLFVDNSHLFMAGVSLCAFLLPFTVSNAWEVFRDKTAQAGDTKRKRIFRAGWLSAVSLLLLVGLTSLTGRQIPVFGSRTAVHEKVTATYDYDKATAAYDKAGLVLNEYASRLLELDVRFSRLSRTNTATSQAGLAKAGYDIKAQEYALEKLLDSLDNKGAEFKSLTAPFRSLLAGHRILSRFQNDKKEVDSN